MLCKLLLVASLSVGVFGSTLVNPYKQFYYDPYDAYSQSIATEYCKATNAEDKVPEVKASIKTFTTCAMGVIDTDAITNDIEAVEDTGDYSGVVKKYCAKSPQLKDCIGDLIKGLAPCLPPGVRNSENRIFALIDFLCDNDGARIISFVKEDGPSCFEEKKLELIMCQREMQANLSKVINVYGSGAAVLMIPEKERCGIEDDGLSCITNALRNCSNKTPGNLAQELHDMYLERTTCTGETNEAQTEVAVGQVNVASQALPPSSGIRKDLDFLMKRKLELEVRTAELDVWNQENKLEVLHTILTSDVKTRL